MMEDNTKLAAYDYDLPRELIAQHPAARRDAARLLVLERRTGALQHEHFGSLPQLLTRGDLLVLNDTRVVPAKLLGRTATGGKLQALLVREREAGHWEALVKCGRRLREDEPLEFEGGQIAGRFVGLTPEGRHLIVLRSDGDLAQSIARLGRVPLPPYIRRDEGSPCTAEDRQRYQTVFARQPGAVAAPTAGLHFTSALLRQLQEAGVGIAFVTLHVGPGTFLPVRTERVAEHRMEAEQYEITPAAAVTIQDTKKQGGRIVAVGTTTCRVLETVARQSQHGAIEPRSWWTDLFIRPPFQFRCVDVLITNFHLPRTTLLMLVSALAGRGCVLHAYGEAVRLGYRFYSYGDAMLIL